MIKKSICATLSAIAFIFGTLNSAAALDAPTNLTCDATSDPVVLDWDDVVDADKYSVDFTCEMDNGTGTVTTEFSIGTSDREDGGELSDSNIDISYEQLEEAAGVSPLTGFQCFAKVKALNPGKNRGRQNHSFSSPATDCGIVQ